MSTEPPDALHDGCRMASNELWLLGFMDIVEMMVYDLQDQVIKNTVASALLSWVTLGKAMI